MSLALAANIELSTDLATCAATTVPTAPPAANFTAAALVAEINAADGTTPHEPASSGMAVIAKDTLTPRRIRRMRRSSRARDKRPRTARFAFAVQVPDRGFRIAPSFHAAEQEHFAELAGQPVDFLVDQR